MHHDRDYAQARGSKDVFVNILTKPGAGAAVRRRLGARGARARTSSVRSCALRLGAPAHPYDTLSFSGEVTDDADGVLTIDVVGRVVSTGSTDGGDHVTAKVASHAR